MRWREADAAIVFVTGHGAVQDGVHWTILRRTEAQRIPVTALQTSHLVTWLKYSGIQHLLLVLDLCSAGAASVGLALSDRDIPPTWLVLPSAARDEEAVVGAFTEAITTFLSQLHDPLGARYGLGPYLDVPSFLAGVQDALPGQRLVPLSGSQFSGPHLCLPNPHYRGSANVAVDQARSDLALPHQDLLSHWGPRSRGVVNSDEPGWLFTGRAALMRRLIAATTDDSGTLVVAGSAGSGKSAALARLVTLSDPGFLQEHAQQVGDIPSDLRPAPGAVDVAVLATGKTSHEVIAQIFDALRIASPDSPGAMAPLDSWMKSWVSWIGDREEPIVIVVDALDEASDPRDLLLAVLGRLDPGVGEDRRRVRLLVGVRSPARAGGSPDAHAAGVVSRQPLAEQATQHLSAESIRVDEEPWWDQRDLASYAAEVLRCTEGSPYQSEPDTVTGVADALADKVGVSFLVARIAATSLAQRSTVVDPRDQAWLATISEGVLGVFRHDLHTILPERADRLRAIHLLRVVAFAYGRGLPWFPIWPPLASAVAEDSTVTYGDSDIATLLASRLSGYLLTDSENGTTVYRLFHDALRSTLREHWQSLLEPLEASPESAAPLSAAAERARAHTSITRRLTQLARADFDATEATPLPAYTRHHLASHAVAAGKIDALVTSNADYLVQADPDALLSAFRSVTTPGAQLVRDVYRASIDHHGGLTPPQRRYVLAVDSARYQAPALREALSRGLPWAPRWATATQATPALEAVFQATWTSSIAHTLLNGRSTVAAADTDGVVQAWDLLTGQPTGGKIVVPDGWVSALACVDLPGRTVVVTGDSTGHLMVWDLVTGAVTLEILAQPDGAGVWAVACPQDSFLAITGGSDGVLRTWDLETGALQDTPIQSVRVETGISALACTALNGEHSVVVGGMDGALRAWNLETGSQQVEMNSPVQQPVTALTCAVVDNSTVAVVSWDSPDGNRGDGTVQILDLNSGEGQRFGPGHGQAVLAATTAVVGERLVAITGGREGDIRMWDLVLAAQPSIHVGHASDVTALSCGTVGNRPVVVSSDTDGLAWGWDLENGTPLHEPLPRTDRISALACSPQGHPPITVIGDRSGNLYFWNLATANRTGPYPTGSTQVWSLACTTLDGRPIALVGGSDGALHIWELETQQPVGEPMLHPNGIRTLICIDDGKTTIAVTGCSDGTLRTWDLTTRQPTGEPMRADDPDEVGLPDTAVPNQVTAISHCPSTGHLIAVTNNWSCDNGKVWVWDLATPRAPSALVTDGIPRADSLACTTSENQPLVAIGSYDGSVQIWNLTTRTLQETLTQPKRVHAIAASPTGELVIGSGWEVITLAPQSGTNII